MKGALSGKWSFPKGHMENNETSLQCATRELLEETGLVLQGESIGYRKLASGGYFVYEVPDETTLEGKNKSEISHCGWFTLEDMKRMRCNIDVNTFCSLMNDEGRIQ